MRPHGISPEKALFLGAWVVGLYQFFYVRDFGFGRWYEMAGVARNLAEHGAFANPFAPFVTGPTALTPPAHPLFLAALIAIFKDPAVITAAAVFASILVNAFGAALLPRLSKSLYGDEKAGVFGGALWLLSMRLMPQWDVGSTSALLVVFCIFTARSMERRDGALGAACAGALGGLLLSFNPAVGIAAAGWLAFAAISGRAPKRYAAKYGAIAALAAAVSVAPWMTRNYMILGSFTLRTSLGINLYVSNNDCAAPSQVEELRNGCFERMHPGSSESEAALVRRLGEVRYDSMRSADAMRWAGSHPGRFAALTARRMTEFWFPNPAASPFTCYAIWAITILSIPGMILMFRRCRPAALFVLWVWAAYPLLYYVVISSDRYRYPILWTSLLPAGYGLGALAGWLKNRKRSPLY